MIELKAHELAPGDQFTADRGASWAEVIGVTVVDGLVEIRVLAGARTEIRRLQRDSVVVVR